MIAFLGILNFASAAFAQEETFPLKGRFKDLPKPPAALFRNQIVAYSLYDPSQFFAASLPNNGKYSFDAAQGFYLLRTTSWKNEKIGFVDTYKIVKVGSPNLEDQPLSVSAVAPDGPTISVGGIQLLGADGKPIINARGMPALLDGGFITPLSNAERRCKQRLVADLDSSDRKQALKEAERRSSDRFDPRDRIDFDRVKEAFDAFSPRFRLTGQVQLSDAPGGFLSRFLKRSRGQNYSADLQVIDLETGEIVSSQHFEGKYDDIFKDIGPAALGGALDSICKDDGISGDTWVGVLNPVSTTCIAQFLVDGVKIFPDLTIIGDAAVTLGRDLVFHRSGANVTLDASRALDIAFPREMRGSTDFGKSGGTMKLQGTYFEDGANVVGVSTFEFVLNHTEGNPVASTTGTATYTIDVVDGGSWSDNGMATCKAVFQGNVLRGNYSGK